MKILKVYKGTNIIKVCAAGGKEKFGFRWTCRGKKYCHARWDTKTEAKEAFDRFKVRMRAASLQDYEEIELTLDILIEDYVDRAKMRGLHKRYISCMEYYAKKFKEFSSTDKLRRLTQNDFVAYQKGRIREEIHNHTINKETAMLRTIFRAASSLFPGFTWTPPKADCLPSLHYGREIVLSREDLYSVLAALKKPNKKWRKYCPERQAVAYDFTVVAIETTLRVSEIVMLQKSDVNFSQGFLHVTSSKTKRKKKIPITPNVEEILKKRMEENKGKYLFKDESRKVETVGAFYRRAFKRACEDASIHYGLKTGGAVFHTIRHSTTTELINKRLPLSTVMAITGHSTKTMVLRYSHPTPETLEQAIEIMALHLP
jgi:integrase